jgi:hypothetical protein
MARPPPDLMRLMSAAGPARQPEGLVLLALGTEKSAVALHGGVGNHALRVLGPQVPAPYAPLCPVHLLPLASLLLSLTAWFC